MAKKSKTRFAILGLLSEGQLSGYDIKKLIGIRFQFFWNESFGQIYPELEKLKREGLVSRRQEDKPGKKKKYIYRITKKGVAALKTWLEKPVEKEVMRLEMLLKIYFGNMSDTANLIRHIREFQTRHKRNLSTLDLFAKEIAGVLKEEENHAYVLLTIDFGKKVYRAYLEWCEDALALLENKKPEGI